MKKNFFQAIILLALVYFPYSLISSTITSVSTGRTGVWSDPASWTGGIVPGVSDIANIKGGDTIYVSSAIRVSILNLYASTVGTSLVIIGGNSITADRTNLFSEAASTKASIVADGNFNSTRIYGLPVHTAVTFDLGGTSSFAIAQFLDLRGYQGGQGTYNLTMNSLSCDRFIMSNAGTGSFCLVNLKAPITCSTIWFAAANAIANVILDTRFANSSIIVSYRLRTTVLGGTILSNNSNSSFTMNGLGGFACSSAMAFPDLTLNQNITLPATLNVAGDLNISASKTLTIGSNTVNVGGDLNCTGLTSITTGIISMNGTKAQGLTFGSETTIPNLDISNTVGGVFLTGTNILNISEQVSFTTAAITTFSTGGLLVLKDYGISGMANLGDLNSHTVAGNITCEYQTTTLTNVAYRHLTSPVSGKSISDFMYNAGTCDSCFYSYGFLGANSHVTGTAVGSTWTYDQANVTATFSEGWTLAVNATDPVSHTRGITWYMGPGGGSFNRGKYAINITGAVNQGAQNINRFNSNMIHRAGGSDFEWALIGNPYPSTINFATVSKSLVNSNPYLFKADNGGYGIDNIIPPFQAFFVRTTGTGASITFEETDKVTTQKAFQKNIKENDELIVKLIPSQYPTKFNYTYIDFKKGTTNNFDSGIDKEPLTNPWPYANVTCETADYKSTYRYVTEPEQGHISIPINAIGYVSGNYELSFSNLNKINGCVILEDKFTGQMINLSEYDSSYTFILSDTTSISRFNLHVYNFTKDLKVENSTCFNANSGSVNLELHKHGSYIATWLKADMGIVEIGSVSDQKVITDLGPGNYSVEIENLDLGCPTSIEYFTIHEPSEIKTNFGFENQLLSFRTNKEIEFKNLSTGGIASYLWDFGDNQTSTETNPVHSYDKAGIYDIVLTSENATPECNVAYKQSVEVAEATGLSELSNSTSYQLVYENGNYWVHFNAASKYDFNYSVYDIQGKKLSNGMIDKGTLVDELSVNGGGILLISINYNDKVETIKVHK